MYLLVGYLKESKAYRLWKRRTRKVIKRRDVHFNEKLSKESAKENDYLEVPLKVLEINSKPANIETNEEMIKEEMEVDTNNEEENENQTMPSRENELINDTNRVSTFKKLLVGLRF